ncbi:molybdopterin-dependent oxidoreductase [Pseudonocardia petroleophila]|uniref:Molybdopterin-dependent oxidoreductase n=1 Tax=Pseudonocardia petroleophila TaxID=37331 RepID=A0A7G7MSS5_9PSEU|nr:molybdopterin-dependent oxidoreductase [Pseudonocardia petroleophila]
MAANPYVTSSSHWGAFEARAVDGTVQVRAHPADPDPSPLLANLASAVDPAVRIARPAIREGWLRDGPGPSDGRGREGFVEVEWDELIEVLAGELRHVYAERGPRGVFGGSYGWASAGRFHHAQSQLKRFLTCLGGYVSGVGNYSYGASGVLMPHVVGRGVDVTTGLTDWAVIREHTELVVAFGGIPRKNTAMNPGGMVRHTADQHLRAAVGGSVDVVTVSPLREDSPGSTWLPIRPASDVAMMLGLMHVLVAEDLHDPAFLERYCVGAPELLAYVTGRSDGVAKSPEWAAERCDVPADTIRALARRMAASRTLVTVTWSLQRTEHGEQAPWAGIALAAVLGQIGLPGRGFGHGYGSMADVGVPGAGVRVPTLPQGVNPVADHIPVARVADMLLHPGEPFEFDGSTLTYPDIGLVYWAGGNPFHHHQDLHRLRRALATVDTVVVHEPFWTAMAKHADIVVPVTTPLERTDIGASRTDHHLVPMHRVVEPFGLARDDHAVLAALADALGVGDAFTEGRSADEWLRHLYETWATSTGPRLGVDLPPYDDFLASPLLTLPVQPADRTFLDGFRADPDGRPLRTPSGRIELFSATIAGFGYDDCPGHPTWLEPVEWLGSPHAARWPLHLIANQPRGRLHSQLDAGAESRRHKVGGREAVRMHPDDAAERGISDGDVVRLFNDRGACLAGARLDDGVRRGVVQLPTGAWFDPVGDTELCAHGNPNVLTRDHGTSRLAQGTSGQHALVEVERFEGDPSPVRAHRPPDFVERPDRPQLSPPEFTAP